jgi:DeoR family fructose operon transcriptional repressor
MITVKRLEEITKILEKEGSVDVNTLCEKFNVTGKTIRQDLTKLEEMGLLERFHGGAILKQNGSSIFPIKQRKQQYLQEKKRIAERALKYVEDDDIIIIDGGSTTLELAKELGEKSIIVITNDIIICNELLKKENITLYVTGGKLRREGVFTLLGHDAEKMVQRYKAKKVFIATSALDFQQGLTVLSTDEAEMKRSMINAAKEIICLADYSKFHQQAFANFANIDDIDILITDDRITEEDRAYLQSKKIKLEVV